MQVTCAPAVIGSNDRMSMFQMAGLLDFVVLVFMTYLFAMFDKDFSLAEVFGSVCKQNRSGLS
jgi:hypothetical protein